jgi:hypothetical protein
VGCNCGQRAAGVPGRAGAADPGVGPVRKVDTSASSGAVIAAARAGGRWRLRTATGAGYDFDTLADARAAQRVHGGQVGRVAGR